MDDSAGAGFRGGLEVLRVVQLDELLDFMGIHLDASRAEGKSIVLNWVFNDRPSDGDQNLAVTTLGNSVINHVIGKQSPDAAATITVGAEPVGNILLGNSTAQAEIDAGRLTIDGNVLAVLEFFSLMEGFPSNFNIVTP